MEKIIDGIEYDTDTARLIGRYNNLGEGADSPQSPKYWEASLYQIPGSKLYFTAGSGGAQSRYANDADEDAEAIPGEYLDPLYHDAAYVWANIFLTPEIVAREFPEIIKRKTQEKKP